MASERRELARQALEVLADIPEEQWITRDIRRGSNYCALGHLGAVSNGQWSRLAWAVVKHFNMSQVNDKLHHAYQQPTPKERVCNYLLDVMEGKR